MNYLLKTVVTYRADSEKEALDLINEARTSDEFELIKYTNAFIEKKTKGEVVDSYYRVTLEKKFNDEKDLRGE